MSVVIVLSILMIYILCEIISSFFIDKKQCLKLFFIISLTKSN